MNYYYATPAGPVCPHCGRRDPETRRHIGKSSPGWCFALHVYPEEGIHDLADWLVLFDANSGRIEDEAECKVPRVDLLREIQARSYPGPMRENMHWRDIVNHAESGPNGLLRVRIDPGRTGCIGHGAGTWDLCVGDFS